MNKNSQIWMNYALIGVILFALYKIYQTFFGGSLMTANALNTLSQGATISSAQAVAIASDLKDSKGWFDDDEDTIYASFNKLNNDADLYLVSQKYQTMAGETLTQWMQQVNQSPYSSNDGTKDEVNSILANRGLTFRF